MSFKSAFGNYRVNEELISTTVQGTNGSIPVFGSNGKISSIIESPIDSNLYIKGGHMQFNTFAEIENIPENQRMSGMEAHLNTFIDVLNPITTDSNTGAITSTNGKVYAFTTNLINVVNPETNTIIKTIDGSTAGLGTGHYILATTDTHIYVTAGSTSQVYEFDVITDTIVRIFNLSTTVFMTSGILVENKLYVGNIGIGTFVHIINITDGVVSRVKTVGGSVDAQFDYPSNMAYSSTDRKVYIFGSSQPPSGQGASNNVYVINHDTGIHINTILPNIGVAAGTAGISPYYTGSNNRYQVFFPTTKKIYALSRYSDTVFTINSETDIIEDIITLPVGSEPTSMIAIGNKLYVVNQADYNNNVNGDVTIIDLLTNIIIKRIELEIGSGGAILQIDYYQNRLFIPNFISNSISVINTNTDTLIGNFQLSGSPRAVTYVVGTNKLYMANQGQALITGLIYQASETYILQIDLVTWERETNISKSGDYIEGVLNYKTDLSSIMNDRSVPDVGFVKELISREIPVNSILPATGTANLKVKVIEIGDWNMDSTPQVYVPHGLDVDIYKKIKSVSFIIRDDNDFNYFPFFSKQIERCVISSTEISITRTTSEDFDSTLFDATSFNRGWITIMYED